MGVCVYIPCPVVGMHGRDSSSVGISVNTYILGVGGWGLGVRGTHLLLLGKFREVMSRDCKERIE